MISHRIFLFVFLLLPVSIMAQEVEKKPEVYDGPKRLESPSGIYPVVEANEGTEGWVAVNFMVDTEGKVFEPTVIGSTGSRKFEKAALDVLKRSKYEPASINGEAVEGSSTMMFKFSLGESWRGARRAFIRNHKKFVRAINDKNEEEASKFIKKYEDDSKLNNYERAYLNFDRANYAALYGTKLEQMQYLNSALLFEGDYDDDSRFLPEDLILSVRKQLFVIQAQTNHFEEAIRSYDLIKRKHGEEAVKEFKAAYDQMIELKNNEKAFSLTAKTDQHGLWSIKLFKKEFSIDNKGSVLNELKLRCSKKYVFLAFNEDAGYEIPESWGNCILQVLGAANSEFDLVQY
ncbi:hypothetical protein NBRC116493_10480 [Aurantivibrio infirmus]